MTPKEQVGPTEKFKANAFVPNAESHRALFSEQARRDLEELLRNEQLQDDGSDESSAVFHQSTTLEQQSRKTVEGVYHELQRRLTAATESSREEKEHRTKQARKLLRNMTKGTQELGMFDNDAALRGYVRQKFIERAMLVVSSFSKLAKAQSFDPSSNRQKIYTRLRSIRKAVSIGCGPGCDGVGVAAWLNANEKICNSDVVTPLEQIVMLDWAMPQWEVIVNPISSILAPELAGSVLSGTCNVLGGIELSDDNRAAIRHCSTADIVVTSYLLSETRGRWYDFYDSVLDSCCTSLATEEQKRGPLFLFTDPTAWQLHEWYVRTPQ